ncbi:MAG: ATP-grasp domain-containing protein [Promethearchaeota archaeon]
MGKNQNQNLGQNKIKSSIFLFEFLSCGGLIKEEASEDLLAEGFSMLSALIKDFWALSFSINLIIDYRLKSKIETLIGALKQNLKQNNYNSTEEKEKNFTKRNDMMEKNVNREINVKYLDSNSDFDLEFRKSVSATNYIMIIAPEFNNIMYKLVDEVETILKVYPEQKMLNPSAAFILTFSDKVLTEIALTKERFSFPSTFTYKEFIEYYENIAEELKDNKDFFKIPKDKKQYFIIKPIDGVGCLDTFEICIDLSQIASNPKELLEDLRNLGALLNEKHPDQEFIIQNKIEGIPLSISAIGREGILSFFVINSQKLIYTSYSSNIEFKHIKIKRIEYEGGETPFTNLPEDIELFLLSKTENIIDKYKISGFIGIDFIYSEKDIFATDYASNICFIEVNPRITTPYIALSELFRNSGLKNNLVSYFFEGEFIQPTEYQKNNSIIDKYYRYWKDKEKNEIVLQPRFLKREQ